MRDEARSADVRDIDEVARLPCTGTRPRGGGRRATEGETDVWWTSNRGHGSTGTRRGAAVVLAVTLAVATTGCGDDADEAAATPQDVVVGVLLDGDDPVAGVELELLVWPSPQSGGASSSPGEKPELVQLDTDTTDEDGSFDLEALGDDLSPHATHDGTVGIEVRQVGSEGRGQGMSVNLTKARDTGVIEVETLEGVELTVGSVGDASS